MKRNMLKINGYVFGNNDSIQDVFMRFVQRNDLYFVGESSNKDNPMNIEIQNDVLQINGYIFGDNFNPECVKDIEEIFYENLDKNNYYFVGTTEIVNTEIRAL